MKPLNSKGMITVDFIFSLVLIFGFTAILFVMSFTLSTASLVQYITFAAARNYSVAHIDQESQEDRGQAKYKELISNPVFKPLFSNGWYKVSAEANVGDHTKIIPAYEEAAAEKNQFWGVGTDFLAPVLDFQIPYFGSTTDDGNGEGAGFKTYMGSYLGREITAKECLDFVEERWRQIRKLSVSSGSSYSTGTSDEGYFAQADDGC